MKKSVLFILVALWCEPGIILGGPESDESGNLFPDVAAYNNSIPHDLRTFSPLFPMVDANTMAATNGLEGFLNIEEMPLPPQLGSSQIRQPPLCAVSIFNHSTRTIGCMALGLSQLSAISLMDSNGRQVEKTDFGKSFGGELSRESIERWRHGLNRHTNMFLKIIPNALSRFSDMPTVLGVFGITEAFQVKHPGQYELHVQIRVVQVGKDAQGEFYYPVTLLHGVKIKVQIGTNQLQSVAGQ